MWQTLENNKHEPALHLHENRVRRNGNEAQTEPRITLQEAAAVYGMSTHSQDIPIGRFGTVYRVTLSAVSVQRLLTLSHPTTRLLYRNSTRIKFTKTWKTNGDHVQTSCTS